MYDCDCDSDCDCDEESMVNVSANSSKSIAKMALAYASSQRAVRSLDCFIRSGDKNDSNIYSNHSFYDFIPVDYRLSILLHHQFLLLSLLPMRLP